MAVQVEVDAVAGASVHGLPVKPPLPELLVTVTLPAGADFVPPSVSDTVAVQTEPWLIATEDGTHVTEVVVDRFVTSSAKPVESELLACTESLAV